MESFKISGLVLSVENQMRQPLCGGEVLKVLAHPVEVAMYKVGVDLVDTPQGPVRKENDSSKVHVFAPLPSAISLP